MRAFRLHILLLLAFCFSLCASAQSYTTVSATTVQDGFGALMASGVACFYPTASDGTFVNITPSGGSAVPGPFCTVVTSGAFSLSTTPNLATAAPSGLLYTLIITKSTGVMTLTLSGLAVTGSTYNLDSLVVPTPPYPSQPSAYGLGIPYYPCLFGALYTRTDASTPATSGWTCQVGGSGTFWFQSGKGVPPPQPVTYTTATQVTLMIRTQGGGVSGVSGITPGTNVSCTPLVLGICAGAVTINASGTGSSLSISTNATPNTSQAALVFTDGNGFAWSNPSGGVEKVGVDGTHYLPLTTDQTNWNAKQGPGSYLTALTGDGTASGPGSAAFTLSTVVTAATCGDATHVSQVTYDAKGRITGCAPVTITAGGVGTVTSVSSADANATVATGTSTPVITIVAAPKLATARNINGVAFDGTAAITITAAPSGSASGALTGSYPNPTIAGLGSTAGFLPKTDGAGNLLASPFFIDSDGYLNLPIGGINMTGSHPVGGQIPGIFIQNTSCTSDVSANVDMETDNSENALVIGHQNACSGSGLAASASISFLTQTGAYHTTPGTSVYSVTNSQLTSNVVTLTATNSLSAGQFVRVFNLTSATFLNNQNYKVLTASGTQFTFTFIHANTGSAAESGNADQVQDNQLDVTNEGGGIINFGFTGQTPLLSVRTGLSTNGVFLPTLTSIPCLGTDSNGMIGAGTCTGGGVSSVSNSDGTLTVTPTTGAVVASIALTHANTWLSIQTFPSPTFTGTVAGANTVPLSILAQSGANTMLGNWTSGTANVTANAMPSCSTSASALNYTTSTGIGCNTSINAATLGGNTFASPAAIGTGTAAAGTFTNVTDSALTAGQNVVAGTSGILANGGTAVLSCADTSASGTAQTCTTSPSFTPAANSCVIYTTMTANTGTGLTLNVNSMGAKSVAKWLGTTTLAANDVKATSPQLACYNGTVWNLSTIGNAPSGGGGGAGLLYHSFVSGSVSVAANNTYVVGSDGSWASVAAAGNGWTYFVILKTGTITSIDYQVRSPSTGAISATCSMSLATTSGTILTGTSATTPVTGGGLVDVQLAGLSIAVTAGDKIQVQFVVPAGATPATSVVFAASVEVD